MKIEHKLNQKQQVAIQGLAMRAKIIQQTINEMVAYFLLEADLKPSPGGYQLLEKDDGLYVVADQETQT